MADSGWIAKTAAITVGLWLPAIVLLGSVWRTRNREGRTDFGAAYWIGIVLAANYLLAVINIVFELSVGYMITAPILGIFLSMVGCLVGMWAAKETRRVYFPQTSVS